MLEQVRSGLAERGVEPGAGQVAALVRAQGRVLGDAAILELVDALRRESSGVGPLDGLLRRPGVTDVLVNGPGQVFVDAGAGLQRAEVAFADDAAVRRLAQRLAATAGRRLDDASPFVDVRLGDGTRLHAVLSPVASPGTLLSLRVPARRVFTMGELVAAGTVPASVARVLSRLVAARRAFLVTGGTGTGKTTLLAALLSLVDPSERLVLVEDSAELRPEHPHVVSLDRRRRLPRRASHRPGPAAGDDRRIARAGAATVGGMTSRKLCQRIDRQGEAGQRSTCPEPST